MVQGVAAERQGARKSQQFVTEDADIGIGSADIDDRDRMPRLLRQLRAEIEQGASRSQGLDIDGFRLQARGEEHLDMAIDHVLLRHGEKHVHVLTLGIALRTIDRLIVHDDFVGGERHLALHLVLHRLRKLCGTHLRQIDDAHDDCRLPADGADTLCCADTRLLEQVLDRPAQKLGIDDQVGFASCREA